MGGGLPGPLGAAAGFVVFDAGVLVLVAVDAEQLVLLASDGLLWLPSLWYGELAQARGGEFAGAAVQIQGKELEGLLAVLAPPAESHPRAGVFLPPAAAESSV